MPLRLVFVHGQGRDGPAAWPVQTDAFPDAIYLSRASDDSLDAPGRVAEVIRSVGTHLVVVAHSFGAIAAALAAAADDGRIRATVLLEPALHALARGEDAVERAIARVDPVFDTDTSVEEFWPDFVAAITGRAFEGTLDDETLRTAARFRRLGPPWRHEVDTDALTRQPVLVVTGGWSDEYEQIAARLEERGAKRVLLGGHGHRPHDHPAFNALLAEFVASIDTAG
ncbi:MAG TPA: alpha/beta fold hydrolase [Pseudolysinimonas sp.]|nr:alpha/beta fold hydrolase [Pseudolysinimonas sp.]